MPRPFKETEPYGRVRGHEVHAYLQGGWYYDRFLNPIEEFRQNQAPKNLARMNRVSQDGGKRVKLGNLGKVDPVPEEIKRAMRENARARKAEELTE